MDYLDTLTVATGIIIALGGIIVAIFYARAKAKTATEEGIANTKDDAMKDMQMSLGLVRDQNATQAKEMQDLGKKVVELSGIVNTLKNIPLEKIEKHMADSTKHMENTNRLIEMLIPLIPKTISVDTMTKTVTTNE